MELLTSFIISVGLNIFIFIPAYFLKTDKLTDISYALTFTIIAIYGLYTGGISLPNILLTLMILIWAIRLGSYLLERIRKIGKDKRFDGMREKFLKFLGFWLFQGITVWVVLLPSIMFFEKNIKEISYYAYVGILIWLIGILIEAIADKQKYNFINNADNKGKWVDTGLWKYSRHPNYFGEIVLWLGVYIYAAFSFTGLEALAGLISPIYISFLLIFVSGIPLLEKKADKKWGENPKYQEYKKRTSVLVLLPPKTK